MSNFAVVFIGSTLFALQQLSGINAVFYFSSSVFKSFGVPSDRANICIGVANFLGMLALTGIIFQFRYEIMLVYTLFFLHPSGSVVAMILMDKLGRRVLLLGSFSGMVIILVLLRDKSLFGLEGCLGRNCETKFQN